MLQPIDNPGSSLFKPARGAVPLLLAGWVLVLAFLMIGGSAQAEYRKAIQIQKFENPADWTGLYDPGPVVSKTLEGAAMNNPNLIWVPYTPAPESSPENPVPKDQGAPEEMPSKPAKSPENQASLPIQFFVKGRILKFIPDVQIPVPGSEQESGASGIAEVQIHVWLVHQMTGRTVAETRFWSVGEGGRLPFPSTENSLTPGHPDFQDTSMGLALERLAAHTTVFLENALNTQPLDSQVMMADEPNERVMINVGARHGVRIQDLFVIHRVISRIEDPFIQADLGDKFDRLGEIQVLNVGENFSEGVILAGGEFKAGDLARGRKVTFPKPAPDAGARRPTLPSAGGKHRFGSPRGNLNTPHTTLTDWDVFSLFGLTLEY